MCQCLVPCQLGFRFIRTGREPVQHPVNHVPQLRGRVADFEALAEVGPQEPGHAAAALVLTGVDAFMGDEVAAKAAAAGNFGHTD